jgi:hypothetical protein
MQLMFELGIRTAASPIYRQTVRENKAKATSLFEAVATLKDQMEMITEEEVR